MRRSADRPAFPSGCDATSIGSADATTRRIGQRPVRPGY